MDGGDVALRQRRDGTGWNQCEKIHTETVPIDLAQAGDFHGHLFTRHVKFNAVAEVEFERLRNTVFEGHHARFVRRKVFACRDFVGSGQHRC